MKTEDTFSLTSIKEERVFGSKSALNQKNLKLPILKSQLGLSNASKGKRAMTSTKSVSNMRKLSQSSVTHDLLRGITERATQ